jgi:hypothetical protein
MPRTESTKVGHVRIRGGSGWAIARFYPANDFEPVLYMKELPRTTRITALTARILPVSSFYLRKTKNRTGGRREIRIRYTVRVCSCGSLLNFFRFYGSSLGPYDAVKTTAETDQVVRSLVRSIEKQDG